MQRTIEHIMKATIGFLISFLGALACAQEYTTAQEPIPGLIPTTLQNPGEPPLAGNPIQPGQVPSSQDSSPSDPPAPFVTVRVRVSAQASPNEEIEYRILVENHSPASAHQVRVRNSLPTHARFLRANPAPDTQDGELIWKLGSLAGNSSKEIRMTVMVLGTGEIESVARVQYEHGQTVKTQIASALQISMTGPQKVMLYDTATYQIQVTNSSNSELANLRLSNLLPDGLEFLTSKPSTNGDNPLVWTIGKLGAGQSQRFEFQAAAKKTGDLVSKATISAGTNTSQETSFTTSVSEIKLSVSMGGPDRRGIQRPASYQVTVANNGTQPVQRVKVSSKLPASLELLAASHSGRMENGEVRWTIPQILPGQRQTLQMVVRTPVAGTLKNRIEVVVDKSTTGTQVEKVTLFEQPMGLYLESDKSIDPIEEGEQTALTLKLIQPLAAASNNVVLEVTIPPELLLIDAKGPGPVDKGMGKVTFAPVVKLEGKKEASFNLTLSGRKTGDAILKFQWKVDGQVAGTSEESILVLPPTSKAPGEPPIK